MHCPRCGHQQNSDEIRFCTKCGLEMSNVKELLAPGDVPGTKAKRKSEINKATRQGMTMIFSGFVLILILAILRDFFTVPKSLFAVSVLIFIIGGAIRMSWPSIFGGNKAAKSIDDLAKSDLETNKLSGRKFSDRSLPAAEFRPPLNVAAKNYETNELVSPSSVTENTTKHLKKELKGGG